MDASIISALAALTGTTVGGLTSVTANWLNNRLQIRAGWLRHEKNRRQILYRDFIEEATKCYINALQHDEPDVPDVVNLYAKIGRMRVLSSKPSCTVPKALPAKSWIPIWSRTRPSSSCATWRITGLSIFCTNSAPLVAKNWKIWKLGSFEVHSSDSRTFLSSVHPLSPLRRHERTKDFARAGIIWAVGQS
jgi:hypothetical protein